MVTTVMALDLDTIQAIDQRVLAMLKQDIQYGTVADRTYDNNALVVFDGSSQAVPVKVFGNVETYAGDRVGLVKFGSYWIVIGSMARRLPSYAWAEAFQSNTGTISGITITDIPNPVTFTFRKWWNTTRVKTVIHGSAWLGAGTGGAQAMDFGARFTSDLGTLDAQITSMYFNAEQFHLPMSGEVPVAGATTWDGVGLPAGTYTVKVWWRCWGTGVIHVDAQDWIRLSCTEVAPA